MTPAIALSLGLLGGTTLWDPKLDDYQWEVAPRAAYGAQARARLGRFGAGLRVWQNATTQRLGDPGTPSPQVRTTSLELIGQGRVASVLGTRLLATASAGRIHLGYHPDHVTFDTPGGPIAVELSPVSTWSAGGGLALERALADRWLASVSVDRQMFALDTAHRNGNTIETRRETFGDWNARLGVEWLIGRH